MKTATSAHSSTADDHFDRSADGNVENRKLEERDGDEAKRPTVFRVGSRVERELDGLWFPGTITDADPDSDCYEIEYDEDMNREGEVSASELRLLDPSRTQEVPVKKELTAQQREMLRKDSLLMQTPDYDPNKAPTVVLHHQGETNAGTVLLLSQRSFPYRWVTNAQLHSGGVHYQWAGEQRCHWQRAARHPVVKGQLILSEGRCNQHASGQFRRRAADSLQPAPVRLMSVRCQPARARVATRARSSRTRRRAGTPNRQYTISPLPPSFLPRHLDHCSPASPDPQQWQPRSAFPAGCAPAGPA
jgi:hypothetical protein